MRMRKWFCTILESHAAGLMQMKTFIFFFSLFITLNNMSSEENSSDSDTSYHESDANDSSSEYSLIESDLYESGDETIEFVGRWKCVSDVFVDTRPEIQHRLVQE